MQLFSFKFLFLIKLLKENICIVYSINSEVDTCFGITIKVLVLIIKFKKKLLLFNNEVKVKFILYLVSK